MTTVVNNKITTYLEVIGMKQTRKFITLAFLFCATLSKVSGMMSSSGKRTHEQSQKSDRVTNETIVEKHEKQQKKRVHFDEEQLEEIFWVGTRQKDSLPSPLQEASQNLIPWKKNLEQLHEAVFNNQPQRVQEILDTLGIEGRKNKRLRRIDINDIKLPDTAHSLLGTAANLGYLEIVQMLLTLGADINHVEPSNKSTALHCAVWNNQLVIAQELLKVDTLKKEHIQSALEMAIHNQKDNSIIQALSEKLKQN